MDNRTGIYQIWSAPIEISSVDVEQTPEIISEFRLEQNYPNPFNPSTKIKFTIPYVNASEAKQSELVTLKVYDVLGTEVVTLLNEKKSAGIYEVEFDARQLPSGIYFYQLRTESFTNTKKMVLLK